MSVWDDIFNHLKKEGFEVYSPSTKKGECVRPYIVLKHSGVFDFAYSAVYEVYNILVYVPAGEYSKISDYKEKVRQSMKKLYPKVLNANEETEPFFDDGVKAFMLEMYYKNYKKKVR